MFECLFIGGIGLLPIFILIYIFKKMFPKYLEEKAKNLATKEDISNITEKIEAVKFEHNKRLDEIKNKNDLFYSEIKSRKERLNSKQFELYNDLWSSLIDLKISADELWNSATIEKLNDFSIKLFNAKISIEKSSLLIEDEHYNELFDIIIKFENYQVGKEKLIDLRNKTNKTNLNNEEIITYFKNINIKFEYDALIFTLKKNFKSKIGINNKI
jgi:hypothetical protein